MATRWAICGAGKIADDFCHAIKGLPASEHQIVAVSARSIEKAAEFASKFGIPNSYGSYEEMAKQDNYDIVYIAVYSLAHVESSLLFINAGKNVLCEKPMAMSSEGCQKVLAAAKEKNVFFAEGYWSRYFPVYEQIKSKVDSGEIGDVRMISAHFTYTAPGAGPETGAGFLMGVGCYTVMFANFLFKGKPESIQIQGHVEDYGTDTNAAIILKYSGDRLATLSYASDVVFGMSNVTVRATKGLLQIPDFMWCPSQLIQSDGQTKQYPIPDVGTKGYYPRPGGFQYQIQGIRDCLLKGLKESPKVPHQDSEDIMSVLDECLKQMGVKYPSL